ncbi:MAG TPA: DUF262 domain-containing protein [bacterium]|nr:DUF262 domain-containing protein [bacterium]
MATPKHVTKTVYKVSDFVSWQRAGNLSLSPNFQRRSVWRPIEKSYLVDTIIRNMPMPIIILRDIIRLDRGSVEPLREVVDGQQRLRTLFAFIDPSVMQDYDPLRDGFSIRKAHNKELAGSAFRDLDRDLQRRILSYELSVHTLEAGTEDREVYQIFARMNSTGVKLNPQELRNARFFGEFKSSMFDLAAESLPLWRKWGIFSEQQLARMQEVELTTELVQLLQVGVVGKSQPSLDRLYKEGEDEFHFRDKYERNFRDVLQSLDAVAGDKIVHTKFRTITWFYTLFALVYDYQYGLPRDRSASGPVDRRTSRLPASLVRGMVEVDSRLERGDVPETLAKVLRGRTVHADARKKRLAYLKQLCGDD